MARIGNQRRDVVIGGAGFAGLALAIALRQGLGEGFAVTVVDPALAAAQSKDPRASAIAAAARRLFEAIEVWDAVAAQAQPILDMVVTDSKLDDAVRPTFLTFGGEVEPGEPFAHMVENRHLVDALVEKAKELGVELRAGAVSGFEHADHAIDVKLADGETMSTRLLVGADGARSKIREQAGIATHGWNYDQSAIVTTVAHEREHNGRAEEHFLPAGPFAILPLTGKRSSIVWTETRARPSASSRCPTRNSTPSWRNASACISATSRWSGRAAPFRSGCSPRARSSANGSRWSATPRISFIRSPGRGSTWACATSRRLAEAIADAARLGLDIGGAQVLERYQRWRRFDTMTMGVATDGLNRLFSNSSDVLRLMRDLGLGVVERIPALKRVFIREAAGFTGDVPKLLRGEAL